MKQTIINYCIDYVKTDEEAKKFMNYYAPDLAELYEWFDMGNFEYESEEDELYTKLVMKG